jgi:hypothetical protein
MGGPFHRVARAGMFGRGRTFIDPARLDRVVGFFVLAGRLVVRHTSGVGP